MAIRIVILGASTFSRNVIRYLNARGGTEVVVVDKDEAMVNSISHLVSRPIIGDVRSYELLERLEVNRADRVVVSVGDVETSLICVLYLRDLNAPPPIVKALHGGHARLLELVGVDDVVFPQKLAADTISIQLLDPSVRQTIDLGDGRFVVELEMGNDLAGKSLSDVRAVQLGMRPILVVNPEHTDVVDPEHGYRLRLGDNVIMYATTEQLYKL